MSDSVHPQDTDRLPTAYGSFTARVRALVIDAVVIMVAIIGIFLLMAISEDWRYSGQLGVGAFAALILLYEPLLVATRGGTVGHRRANLRVVSVKSGTNPTLVQAFVRYWVKGVLGLLSFVTMALTRRHQAVHDRVTGTTVQIVDLEQARDSDVLWERTEAEPGELPSLRRRILVISSYSLASFVAMTVVMSLALSDACLLAEQCTPREDLFAGGVALGWLGAVAVIVIFGWRGNLWGCRRRGQRDDLDSAAA